jgi:hypothetical protein
MEVSVGELILYFKTGGAIFICFLTLLGFICQ